MLLLPKYSKTQVNSLLNVSMQFIFIFISTLTNIIGKSTGYFYPSLPKDITGPMQIKRYKCYSLMLICLKIKFINLRTK